MNLEIEVDDEQAHDLVCDVLRIIGIYKYNAKFINYDYKLGVEGK